MSIINHQPEFLYPKSRQYPFDETCEKIVRALERRNFKVPGIKVEFNIYGSGEDKYQYVRNIYTNSFKLHFGRKQGMLDERKMDAAACEEITIPRQQIRVREDESGPTFYLYVGNNWDKDKESFINGYKVNSKLYKKPRTYLTYKGSWSDECYYSGQRAPLLVHTNDLKREYDPKGDEPKQFNVADKLEEFNQYLSEKILGYILSFPESEIINSPFVPEKLIPYKGEWPTVYGIAGWKLSDKVRQAKIDVEQLPPEERYASFGGRRLVPLDLAKDEAIPEIATEGFAWCSTDQNTKENSCIKDILDYNRDIQSSGANLIVAVQPKWANGVYVIDNAPFEATRQQIFEAIKPRDRLTDEELAKAYAARGKTIVPVNKYKGGYKEPMVLIEREIDLDEIAWIQDKEIKPEPKDGKSGNGTLAM